MKIFVQSKMAAALSKATHKAIKEGRNTGCIGRVVLTHEASMKMSNKKNNKPAVSA
jgi:hypothetical protein